MCLLQQAGKKALKKELASTKFDEHQRAKSRSAAKCANIKHIWQLESTDYDYPERAKSMITQIHEFIEKECEPMGDQLLKADDLRRALKERSTALDGLPLCLPRVDLNDKRSDRDKLVLSAAVDAKLSLAAAAAMAWPAHKSGETMTLSELAATSGGDVALPVGKWVCLGLCLSTTSGLRDNNRTHYLALKLVKVGPDKYAVCVCDGIETEGQLHYLEAGANTGPCRSGIYVAFGLHVDSQLFSRDFARELTNVELVTINLGQQRANVCAFNTVYALLALNPGLCELLALGGALTVRDGENAGVKAMRALQYCMFGAWFDEASCMEANSKDFVQVIERSMRRASGKLYDQGDVQLYA